MIEFRNVNKTYDTGTVAVNNANFKIDKGEFAFLVGSSGSGKSTLIKLILKEEEPTSGNIIINGKDTTFLKSVADQNKMAFHARVRYKAKSKGNDTQSKWSANIEYDGTKVDTIKVFEDFEFPFSYKNLRYTYPSLQIVGIVNRTYEGKGFIYGLYIDRVIMRSKETGEETILDPSAN